MRIIPEELNKKIKREYKLRFLTVLFWVINIVLVITIALMSSSYLLIHLYEKAYVNKNTEQDARAIALENVIHEKIKNLYKVSKKIPSDQATSSALDISNKIFSYAGSGITIQSLEVLEGNTITLRGLAENRDSLLLFESKIKADGSFVDFAIPIESLARQKDIGFSVTFTYHEN